MELLIDSTGNGHCIYSETMNLSALGQLSITRASHVEPNADSHWLADLQPMGGPLLGPFELRSVALAAEVAWLQSHWLER